METLGSMFLAHPPIQPFTVNVVKQGHPLVRGISSFTVTDEQYLVETYGTLEVLLNTTFEGETVDFVHAHWPRQNHPVFYLNRLGKGAVLYLTLGHCRGHYDMEPLDTYYAEVERCAWGSPVYYTLLRRGIDWMKEPTNYVGIPTQVA
jgi:type 1 glutamine amidotransferase